MYTNAVELADDLLEAFGGAVLSPAIHMSVATTLSSQIRKWAERHFPYLDHSAPCARSFAVPGWWPPTGPGPLTNDQVSVLIDSGNIEALRRAFAEGRIPRETRDDIGRVTRAVLALRPDIAAWLMITYGDRRPDVRFARVLLTEKGPDAEEVLEWLKLFQDGSREI